MYFTTLLWRHNGRGSVSNHQPYDCLLNRLFRRRSKKTTKLRVTGLCVGNSPGTGEFPAQMASNAENVSIWWRHHEQENGWGWTLWFLYWQSSEMDIMERVAKLRKFPILLDFTPGWQKCATITILCQSIYETIYLSQYPFKSIYDRNKIIITISFKILIWFKYTLGKKGCYTPIEDNKTNVDRTFVFPLGWNWHDMDPSLFPNEIRHYLGQTFNARSSGVVELRNHSIGGRSPKSIFTLWQLWINICIFFQKFFWLFEQCPVQPLWVLGRSCLHLPVRALNKVLLLPVWVWLVLPSTAYSKGMLPLDLWCQASLQGLPERQHLGKTVHCWGWSDRIVSWVLGPWMRGWEICTEWGLVAQRLRTDSCPVVTGHIDPQRSPCWLPTTVVSAWSGRRGGGTWQWPTGSMSSSVMSRDSNFTR